MLTDQDTLCSFRCLPEELLEHEGFTTNAVAKVVELIDGILATTVRLENIYKEATRRL